MSDGSSVESYVPDYRLREAYREANLIDDTGLEALCPSYVELSESNVRYREETPLGQGAFKTISQIYDTRSKRWVAIARLREERGPEYYDRFVHEAWLTSSLNHPNIIKVYDVGLDESGQPYFTMDLKRGNTLADVCKPNPFKTASKTPWERRRLLEVLAKICDAMAYAHSIGVVHLDLKPSNIQVDQFGEVLVCDWGLGKVIGGEEVDDMALPPVQTSTGALDNMTLDGEIKGTLGFMAPEQVIPEREKDQRTDVFALGCILYTILTHSCAFSGATNAELLAQTGSASIVPPRSRFPYLDIPVSLEAIVLKATAADPTQRYSSVDEMRQDLNLYLSGYATTAERFSLARNTYRFIGRNRAAAAVFVLAVATLFFLAGLFGKRINQQFNATKLQENRAEELENAIASLTAQHTGELENIASTKSELAASIAQSAKETIDLGIFDRPLQTVSTATKLADLALSLDPDCPEAYRQRVAVECLQMDFKRAHRLATKKEGTDLGDFAKIAAAFRDLSFDHYSRPTISELAEFLRAAREVPGKPRPDLMERIVAYDFALRENKHDYDEVLEALLSYRNPKWQSPVFSYDNENKSLVLGSTNALHLRAISPGYPGGSERSFLRFLNLSSLRLKMGKPMKISKIDGLLINRLDVRECLLTLDSRVTLPGLTEIHVTEGTVSPKILQKFIWSAGPIQIVEHPPTSTR